MAVELIIAPEVKRDLAETYAWYEARRPELGDKFLSCVDAGIAAICRMPEWRWSSPPAWQRICCGGKNSMVLDQRDMANCINYKMLL
jgi:hypothetical protein